MYFIQVLGWNTSLMDPKALEDYQETENAHVIFSQTNPYDNRHCPAIIRETNNDNHQILFESKKFKIKTGGHFSKFLPKPSLKIKLDDQKFLGQEILYLRALSNDPSMMREPLALELFAKAKVIGPRQCYVKVCINDKYFGLYSLTEEIDESFIKERFHKKLGKSLYKAVWEDEDLGPPDLAYRGEAGKFYFKNADKNKRTYFLKYSSENSNENSDVDSYEDLALFIKKFHASHDDGEKYIKDLESLFDVRGFLRWAALNTLLGAWDNYWLNPNNYYLYNENNSDPTPFFHWIPWDYDNSFGLSFDNKNWARSHPFDLRMTNKIPLIENILMNKTLRRYYQDCLLEFLNDFFNEKYLSQRVQSIWSFIKTAVYLESDFPDCRNSGYYSCAHTGRTYSNHEIYDHVKNEKFIFKNGLKAPGITAFVRERYQYLMTFFDPRFSPIR